MANKKTLSSEVKKNSKKRSQSKDNSADRQVLLIVGVVLFTIILLVGGLFFYNTQRKNYFRAQYDDMDVYFNKALLASQSGTSDTTKYMENFGSRWLFFYRTFYNNPVDPYDEDSVWRPTLNAINSHVILADESARNGQYENTYYELLTIKKLWNGILLRNNMTDSDSVS